VGFKRVSNLPMCFGFTYEELKHDFHALNFSISFVSDLSF